MISLLNNDKGNLKKVAWDFEKNAIFLKKSYICLNINENNFTKFYNFIRILS
jgi:hypothetical protein